MSLPTKVCNVPARRRSGAGEAVGRGRGAGGYGPLLRRAARRNKIGDGPPGRTTGCCRGGAGDRGGWGALLLKLWMPAGCVTRAGRGRENGPWHGPDAEQATRERPAIRVGDGGLPLVMAMMLRTLSHCDRGRRICFLCFL